MVFKILLTALLAALTVVSFEGTFNLYQWSPLWIGAVIIFGALGFLLLGLINRSVGILKRSHFLVALILTALALRVAWIVSVPNVPVSDFAIYHELGAALASGQGYAITGPAGIEDIEHYIGGTPSLPYLTAYRSPGVPLWAAAVYKIFGVNPLWMKLLNIVLGVLSCFILFLIVEHSPYALYARSAAFLLAVYPTAVMATSLVGSEIPFLFCLLLFTFFLSQKNSSHPFAMMAAAGLVASQAVLIRCMLWPLMLAVALFLGIQYGWKRGGGWFLYVSLFIALGLSPWSIRNWRAFQRFIPICTSEGYIAAQTSRGIVPAKYKDEAWEETNKAWEALPTETEKAARGYALGRRNLVLMFKGGPAHITKVLWTGFKNTFKDDTEVFFWAQRRSWYNIRTPNQKPNVFSEGSIFIWNAAVSGIYLLIILGALFGGLKLDWNSVASSGGVLFLVATFLAFVGSHILLNSQPRYHFYMMPLLLVLFAMGQPKKWSTT
jgi:hypothetical protein